MSWIDSLSLTSAPLNHRLRYRALCAIRTKMYAQYWRAVQEGSDSTHSVLRCAALRRAFEQLESMHRYADQYLRVRP